MTDNRIGDWYPPLYPHPCPGCGYCPTCGRYLAPPPQVWPYVPYQPPLWNPPIYAPYYPTPTWQLGPTTITWQP